MTKKIRKKRKRRRKQSWFVKHKGALGLIAALLLLAGIYAWPETTIVPVQGAGPADWNAAIFWDCPWCTRYDKHMGIDIIRNEGTPVLAATHGMVLYNGWLGKYGRAMIVLSPALRLHLYGHLYRGYDSWFPFVRRGTMIGIVGNTGLSDCPHLHYSIFSILPRLWLFEKDNMGWLKIFVLNPHDILLRL